jgi:hypothetical protein
VGHWCQIVDTATYVVTDTVTSDQARPDTLKRAWNH